MMLDGFPRCGGLSPEESKSKLEETHQNSFFVAVLWTVNGGQPLEDGAVMISRAATSIMFPARVMPAATMNPSPCGFFGDPTRQCHCSPSQIQCYVSKISGPLIDCIDIHIEAPAVKYKELRSNGTTEESAVIRERVLRARERQSKRYAGERKGFSNVQMPPKLIREFCAFSEEGDKMLENSIGRLGLSARGYDRILKVASTIADLDASLNLEACPLGEAIQIPHYRTLDRTHWA